MIWRLYHFFIGDNTDIDLLLQLLFTKICQVFLMAYQLFMDYVRTKFDL